MPIDLEPASLIVGLIVSSIGLGLFLFGKKQARVPQLVAGIVLMALPFLVPGAALQCAVSAVVVAATWWKVRSA